jgi:hypothetical protein
LVNYKELKANREPLDRFVKALGQFDKMTYRQMEKKEKIAFLINAYNAFVLSIVVEHYPIKGGLFASLFYPRNSIQHIHGVFDSVEFELAGEKITLDGLEHEQLRRDFIEPRIHTALVCASMSCPPLRNEPYLAEKLDSQLNDQAKRFLSDPKSFRINKKKNRVYLSRIFKWFDGDFVRAFESVSRHSSLDVGQRAVISFIVPYVEPDDGNYLSGKIYTIEYFEFDWSLNVYKP